MSSLADELAIHCQSLGLGPCSSRAVGAYSEALVRFRRRPSITVRFCDATMSIQRPKYSDLTTYETSS